MKTEIYENTESKNRIIELFGLPKSGKSTYIERVKKEGKKVFSENEINYLQKTLLFLKYWAKHPISTAYLFYMMNSNWVKMNLGFFEYLKIWRMRNSYLAAVFAKYEYLRNYNYEIYADEFIMQSIFMIFHKKAEEREIRKVLEKLPKSRKILILEEEKEKRYERWKKIKKPARSINIEYRMKWWANSEKNYEVIKKIISQRKQYILTSIE